MSLEAFLKVSSSSSNGSADLACGEAGYCFVEVVDDPSRGKDFQVLETAHCKQGHIRRSASILGVNANSFDKEEVFAVCCVEGSGSS